ncbi:choice-of-anchor H family protein [Pleionea litopenaei]|uniref:Choice-of-anchor H family protein n=1 Tax=Pleionea litopenaei TaxID=3070815 RepID=A0AA51RVI2_9GAMM|nr:choice-of-anchor H family protein [Pleionea sp. HL-JVS1]WMS88347.1 choice-of-anchor H family protein [Pleionea sp. HL-JVS1]
MKLKHQTLMTLASVALTGASYAQSEQLVGAPASVASTEGVVTHSSTSDAKNQVNKNAGLVSNKVIAENSESTTVARKDSRAGSAKIRQLTDVNKTVKTSKSKLSETAKFREKSPAQSSKYHEFYFFDADAWLLSDVDGDGYYSEFRVTFDADTIYDFADVYAVLYLSRNGGPWQEYHVTDVFEINGESGSDDYQVTTRLNFDFPPGDYDVLVDLYEYGYSGIVATISAEDDIHLSSLPLEDLTFEDNYDQGFWFYDVATDLISDSDNDGYYSQFAITFDVDTDFASAEVYAEIFFINEDGNWELEYTSNDFWLDGESAADQLVVEFDWNAGYPTGLYDFKVVIRDSVSQERLAQAGPEYPALSQVPLESYDRDNSPSSGGGTGGSNGGGSSSSYESGGGSFVWLLPLLAMLLPLRTVRKRVGK